MSVPFKTHDLLSHNGVVHGFFGRQGGVSEGQYASLNVGQGSKDLSKNIIENRARVAKAVGTSGDKLLSLSQIHSTEVLIVDAPFDGTLPKADGLVTKTPNLAISALAACLLYTSPSPRDRG